MTPSPEVLRASFRADAAPEAAGPAGLQEGLARRSRTRRTRSFRRSLEVAEAGFPALQVDQRILVDFGDFPARLIELPDACIAAPGARQPGRCTRLLAGKHRDGVTAVAVSPTGKTLASGGADGSVYVWDLNSGRCMAQLKGPADQVCSLSFTSHGNMLAGGSLDQAVRLWSVGSRASAFQELQPCKTLRTKSSPVLSVRFTRGNLLMAFGTFTPGGAAAAPKAPKEP